MDYKDDIAINEDSLDTEWLNQPRLTYKYSKVLANLEKAKDKAKENVDFVKATIDKDIRLNPEKYDITKITESVVMNAILLHSEYKEAMDLYLEAKFEMKVAFGVVNALQDKKVALENLVKLHGQQYFAGPSVPRDLSKEWEAKQKEKQTNANVASKMRRRRR